MITVTGYLDTFNASSVDAEAHWSDLFGVDPADYGCDYEAEIQGDVETGVEYDGPGEPGTSWVCVTNVWYKITAKDWPSLYSFLSDEAIGMHATEDLGYLLSDDKPSAPWFSTCEDNYDIEVMFDGEDICEDPGLEYMIERYPTWITSYDVNGFLQWYPDMHSEPRIRKLLLEQM